MTDGWTDATDDFALFHDSRGVAVSNYDAWQNDQHGKRADGSNERDGDDEPLFCEGANISHAGVSFSHQSMTPISYDSNLKPSFEEEQMRRGQGDSVFSSWRTNGVQLLEKQSLSNVTSSTTVSSSGRQQNAKALHHQSLGMVEGSHEGQQGRRLVFQAPISVSSGSSCSTQSPQLSTREADKSRTNREHSPTHASRDFSDLQDRSNDRLARVRAHRTPGQRQTTLLFDSFDSDRGKKRSQSPQRSALPKRPSTVTTAPFSSRSEENGTQVHRYAQSTSSSNDNARPMPVWDRPGPSSVNARSLLDVAHRREQQYPTVFDTDPEAEKKRIGGTLVERFSATSTLGTWGTLPTSQRTREQRRRRPGRTSLPVQMARQTDRKLLQRPALRQAPLLGAASARRATLLRPTERLADRVTWTKTDMHMSAHPSSSATSSERAAQLRSHTEARPAALHSVNASQRASITISDDDDDESWQ